MKLHAPYVLMLAASLALAACQAPIGAGTAILQPVLVGERQLLSVPYVRADIRLLVLKLFRVEDATEIEAAEATIPIDRLGAAVSFGNLHPYKVYWARAFAYADEAGTTLISDTDASQVEIVVGANDDAIPITVPVALASQTIITPGAPGSTSLDIQPGAYLSPTPPP